MVRVLNFVLYQIGWFACVLGAAYAAPWLGISVALSLVAIHLWLATDRLNQFKLLIAATCVGLVVDSILLTLGVYQFPSGMLVAWLPPLWMSVLWMQFATTFQYCLNWLSGHYVVSAVFGFVGAPLVFLAGQRLGAVSFLPPLGVNLMLLAVLWGVAIPVLIYMSDRIHAAQRLPASYRVFQRS